MNNLSNIFIIFGAKYLLFFMLAVAFVFFLKQPRNKQKQIVVFGLITCVLAFVLSRIASQFYYDPRPFVTGQFIPLIPHAPDNGFPSDHTLLAGAISVVTLYFNRKLGALLSAMAVFVGVSRVVAGVHNPVDIVGSIVIAIIASFAVYKFIMPPVVRSKMYKQYFN